MKKLFLICVGVLMFSYLNAQKNCGFAILTDSLQAYPNLNQKYLDYENFVSNYAASQNSTNSRLINSNGLIIIPVVVHILHQGEDVGVGFNISDAVIQSQIDVLNEDFRRFNADAVNTPSDFLPVAADLNIEFRLACVDPNGNSTNGIIRKNVGNRIYGLYKRGDGSVDLQGNGLVTSDRGSVAWPTDKYLNIWVCNFGHSGVGQFPTIRVDHPDEDGVVVNTSWFGRTGTSGNDLGRLTTHEVGHWLGLLHTFENGCIGDVVDDTPAQNYATGGCPTYPRHIGKCNPNDPSIMFMNYMDYSDDICLNLFTQGQKTRARANFAQGTSINGPRFSLLENILSIPAGQIIKCRGKAKAFNPLCLPLTWTVVSGPATIVSGQGSSEALIQASGTGFVLLRATGGNYITEDLIWVNLATEPVTLTPFTDGCNQFSFNVNGAIHYSSFQWTSTNGDLTFNGSSTSTTTTVPTVTAYGSLGQVNVSAITHSACNITSNNSIVVGEERKLVGLYPEYVQGDHTSVSVNLGAYDTYYKWYLNNVLVLQGQFESNFCTCDFWYELRNCAENRLAVEITTSCSTINLEGDFYYICYGALAMDSLDISFTAYPNPADNQITVSLRSETSNSKVVPKIKEIKTITLYDKMGMLRRVYKFGSNTRKTTINLNGLPSDIYSLEVSDGIKSERKQIIVKGH